jgi:hypothetical protein
VRDREPPQAGGLRLLGRGRDAAPPGSLLLR